MKLIGARSRCLLGSLPPLLVVAALILSTTAPVRAHDIPADVLVNMFVKPEGNRLRLLVRVPLGAMRDMNLPLYGPSYLKLPAPEAAIRDAAGNPVLDASGNPTRQVADANGVSAGAQLAVGPLQLGGTYYRGSGLTLIVPIFNTPIFADQNNILRHGQGFAGMASLTFGGTKIAGGAGVSQLKLTSSEVLKICGRKPSG